MSLAVKRLFVKAARVAAAIAGHILKKPRRIDTRSRSRASNWRGQTRCRNQIVPTSPGRLYIPSMSLSWLIYTGYGDGGLNTAMRVTSGPEWVNRTSYAVDARA